jgi:hypothetical protein
MTVMKSATLSVVALSAALSAFAAACVDAPETGDDSVETTDIPRISINSLTPAQLFNATLDASTLTTTSLNTMAATADGRAALKYVIGCSLPSGTSVTATVGGMPVTFSGDIGLAPNWTQRGLSTSERHWVSACTLARLNEFGTAVQISLRGAATPLALQQSEGTGYTIQEGAFFGDVFQGAGFYVAACQGVDTTNADRQCAQPNGITGQTPCGLDFVGACADACGPGPNYGGCQGLNQVSYDEVITTYLAPGT